MRRQAGTDALVLARTGELAESISRTSALLRELSTTWSEFFGHGLGARYYGYGWRSEEEDALDVWAIIDIEVLNQLGEKGVAASSGRARHGRGQSFMAYNLRQLREAAKPAELVPHYSPGHPALSGVPFAHDS